ncbi:MAG: hypothetical protein JNL33_10865 [Betaproteobacteria bacterium]|nr:hypothetical protein [Betaproteobacteria bacterium]
MKLAIRSFALLAATSFGTSTLQAQIIETYAPAADEQGILWRLIVGTEVTTGRYGSTSRTSVVESTVGIQGDTGNDLFWLTGGMIRITADRDVLVSEGSVVVGDAIGTERFTTEGRSDTYVGWLHRTMPATSSWQFDYTARAKLATADVDRGLGSGRHDYTLQLNVGRHFPTWTVRGEGGYRFFGDPPWADLKNGPLVALGVLGRLTDRLSMDAFMDYRSAVVSDANAQIELSVSIRWKIQDGWRIQTHVLRGFTDSSPDFGGGIALLADL